MVRYAVIIAFALLYISESEVLSQTKKNYSEEYLLKIAKEFSRIQMQCDEAQWKYELLSRDNLLINEDELKVLHTLSIKDDEVITLKVEIDSAFHNSFIVARSEYAWNMVGNAYFLALGYDGSVYMLSGFNKRDFNKLVQEKIGEVQTNNKALKVAILYLQTVKTLQYYYRGEFVQSNNVEKILKYCSMAAIPQVRKEDGCYIVAIDFFKCSKNQETQEIEGQSLMRYNLKIFPDGQVVCSMVPECQSDQ